MPIVGFETMKLATLFGVVFTPAEWRNRSVELTPAEAVARDLCPETGHPLADLNIQDHIMRLYPKGRSAEGIERIGLLQKWEADHAEAKAPEVK